MARKQEELPSTRRDDEAPLKSIAELDEACTDLEKAKGKAIKANQDVQAKKQTIDALLRKHKLTSYHYADLKDVERIVRLVEKIKTEKVKTDKTNDEGDE